MDKTGELESLRNGSRKLEKIGLKKSVDGKREAGEGFREEVGGGVDVKENQERELSGK